MKIQWALVLGVVWCAGAAAETTPCNVAAAEKKLAGASKQEFLKSCEATARAACAVEARGMSLAGEPKIRFEKKCLRDAMGD